MCLVSAVSPLSLLWSLQVSISHTVTHSDQQSLEIDNYLDSSILDSSFPTFPGLQAEVTVPSHSWAGSRAESSSGTLIFSALSWH